VGKTSLDTPARPAAPGRADSTDWTDLFRFFYRGWFRNFRVVRVQKNNFSYFEKTLLRPFWPLKSGFGCAIKVHIYYEEDAMSEFSNEPMIPSRGPEMSLIDTWIEAFTKPKEETFARIAAQPGASVSKALLWVFVASLLTSLVGLVAQSVSAGGQLDIMRQFLPPEIARELPAGVAPSFGIGTIICGAPVGALFAMLGFAISTALIQWVAKLFGGTGTFDKLAYAFSSAIVPYSVVASVLALLGMIPIVGILTGLISFALSIYLIVLEVLAVKAVNRLDTGKAVGAVLLPGLAIALIVCCCIVVGIAALGPLIGDVFDSINQSLGGF
jgi:hypothetical protein